MKNLSIFILECFFLSLAFLWEAKQSITRSIYFSLIIIDSEMVLKELLGLADLTKAQIYCIHKLTEVVIVSKDEDLVFAALQVVAPSLESLNNNEELLIMSLESSLCRIIFQEKKAIECHVPISNLEKIGSRFLWVTWLEKSGSKWSKII